MARYTVFFHNMYRRFVLYNIYRVHSTLGLSAVSIRKDINEQEVQKEFKKFGAAAIDMSCNSSYRNRSDNQVLFNPSAADSAGMRNNPVCFYNDLYDNGRRRLY